MSCLVHVCHTYCMDISEMTDQQAKDKAAELLYNMLPKADRAALAAEMTRAQRDETRQMIARGKKIK